MSDSSPASDMPNSPEPTAAPRAPVFHFVGEYGLLVRLGEGGMGEVWAARDTSAANSRIVALKTTKQQGAEAARVLWDEARIASMIEHPNVCRVHDLGRSGDLQYLVMDYCDGASLHDLLQEIPGGKLPLELGVRVVSLVAAGLHASHELVDEAGNTLEVVHRDVSPQNILVSSSGHVTVTDFGVAKALGQAHKATETGEMKGKLSYMAPEQVTSKEIDRRADVFALGCVLYQVTLGHRPFHGDDALATLYQLLEEDLELPSSLEPNYPKDLEKIVLRALAKDPDERFDTAVDMAKELELFLVSQGTRVSEAQIGAVLQEHLGAQIAELHAKVERRNAELQQGDVIRQSGVDFDPALPQSAAAGASQPGAAFQSNTLRSESDEPKKHQKKSKQLIPAIALFAIIALGGSAAILLRSKTPAVSPDEPTKRSSSSSDDAPAVEQSVVITVSTTPADAQISLDGVAQGTGQWTTSVTRSPEGHLLLVQAKNHEAVTRAIVFDHNQTIHISLPALSPSPEEANTDAKVEKATTAKSGPTQQPKSSTLQRPAQRDPEPKTNKKPPRTLDSENPFASQ